MIRRSGFLGWAPILVLLMSAWGLWGDSPQPTHDPFTLARPFIRLYGVETGLPSGTVYNLARDASGHLWAATQEGPARFDGLTWTPVGHVHAKGPCRGILARPDGTLWAGYEAAGLWRLQGDVWTSFEPETGINQVFESREAHPGLWAATRGKGLLRWTGHQWEPGGLAGQWIWKVNECLGPDGQMHLWAVGQQGLWRLGGDGWRREGADYAFLNEVNGVDSGVDAEGRFQLWVSCWRKGVARWDGQRWTLFTPAQGFPSLLPTTLRFDPKAPGGPTLWVGTYDIGLAWFQGEKWNTLGAFGRGNLIGVYSLLPTPDQQPNLWFGARGRGVGSLDLGSWRSLDAQAGLALNSVAMIARQGHRMWIGASGGLNRIEGGRFFVETGPGAPSGITNAVLVEGQGGSERMWAATTLGLHLKKGGIWKALGKENGVPEGPAYSMTRTQGPAGPRLWVGTEGGLLCLEQGRWRKLSRKEGAPGEWVYALIQNPQPDGEPDLWVGTRDAGVARYRKGGWTAFPVVPNRAPVWCNSLVITQGRDGRRWLWSAFLGLGLGRLELGREEAGWRIWGPDNLPDFPTRAVFSVTAHPNGSLFLGTSKGVVRVHLAEGNDGPLPTHYQRFTKGDGLPSENASYFASLVDEGGRVWMGTDEGVAVLDPASEIPNKTLPTPSIERLEVGSTSLVPGPGFQLRHGQTRMRLTFFWPVFHRREDARFRTQLVGLEAEPGPWQTEAYREFTGLPRGHYTLRLWARDHAGHSATPVEWSFEVLPAAWATWWAFLAYVIATVGLIGIGIRRYFRNLQAEKADLEWKIRQALAVQEEKQRALKESEERYALAAQGANEGIWDYNFVTRRLYVSERLPGILGMDPTVQDLEGGSWDGLIHPEDAPRVERALRAHLKERVPYDVEFRLRTQAGEYRWFRSRGQAMWGPDGRALRMGGSIGDITERRRAQEELLAAKESLEAKNRELERLDETVKAINQEMDLESLIHELLVQITARFPQVQRGMFLLRHEEDNTFRTEAVHCASPEITRASKAFQLPVLAAEAWFHSRPEDLKRGVCLVSDIASLPGFNRMQFPPKAMLILPIVIRGVIEGILGLHNDEDPRAFEAADLEKLLRFREHILSAVAKARSFQQLDNMVRDLAESMQTAQSAREIAEFEREEARKARTQAEAANQAKSAFLANMSHEIRTPMNAVMGFSQLGQRLDLEGKPRDYFEKIATASKSLLGIINDILDFSKVEAGRLELETIPFKLSQVVANLRDLFAQTALDKGLALRVAIAEDSLETLVGDPLRLSQVLINLTSNALKFTPAGGVQVDLKAVSLGQGQVTLQVTVTDSGIGMTESQVAGLFQPFVQADNSTTRKYGGTGLGLTISKRIVELMGGALAVVSEPGKGSTFSVHARLAEADAAQAARLEAEQLERPALSGPDSLPNLRVLLVEDNPINQEVAREILAGWGVRPEVANSGIEALRILEHHAFDLVLMDVQMPDMDGYETTHRIRQMAPHTGLPILAMTANAMDHDRQACLEAGMNDFLSKPIEPDHLLAALRRWGTPAPSIASPRQEPSSTEGSSPLWDRAGALRRLGGNEGLLDQLLAEFRRDQSDDAAAIRAALDAEDIRLAERLAHTLKGVAGNLGAKRLQAAAGALEKALRQGEAERLPALQEALAETLSATLGQTS